MGLSLLLSIAVLSLWAAMFLGSDLVVERGKRFTTLLPKHLTTSPCRCTSAGLVSGGIVLHGRSRDDAADAAINVSGLGTIPDQGR